MEIEKIIAVVGSGIILELFAIYGALRMIASRLEGEDE